MPHTQGCAANTVLLTVGVCVCLSTMLFVKGCVREVSLPQVNCIYVYVAPWVRSRWPWGYIRLRIAISYRLGYYKGSESIHQD